MCVRVATINVTLNSQFRIPAVQHQVPLTSAGCDSHRRVFRICCGLRATWRESIDPDHLVSRTSAVKHSCERWNSVKCAYKPCIKWLSTVLSRSNWLAGFFARTLTVSARASLSMASVGYGPRERPLESNWEDRSPDTSATFLWVSSRVGPNRVVRSIERVD